MKLEKKHILPALLLIGAGLGIYYFTRKPMGTPSTESGQQSDTGSGGGGASPDTGAGLTASDYKGSGTGIMGFPPVLVLPSAMGNLNRHVPGEIDYNSMRRTTTRSTIGSGRTTVTSSIQSGVGMSGGTRAINPGFSTNANILPQPQDGRSVASHQGPVAMPALNPIVSGNKKLSIAKKMNEIPTTAKLKNKKEVSSFMGASEIYDFMY